VNAGVDLDRAESTALEVERRAGVHRAERRLLAGEDRRRADLPRRDLHMVGEFRVGDRDA